MDISIQKEVSVDLMKLFKDVQDISDYLKLKLANKFYHPVQSCIITLHCINPDMFPKPTDFETGLVIDKKYTKTNGFLGLTVKLNYAEVKRGELLKNLISTALSKATKEIEKLHIPDFSAHTFIMDLLKLLNEPGVNFSDYRDTSLFKAKLLEPKEFPPYALMDEDDFWEIIEKSLRSDKGPFDFLIDHLTELDMMQMIGFECRLRKLIMESYHYNVLALHKIISEFISDDDFLYFRCNLILSGKYVFRMAIENPESFKTKLSLFPNAEPLLAVSDEAFYKKLGKDTHQESPSTFASQFLDYSTEVYDMEGISWEANGLKKRYPTLWYRYRPIN